MEYSEILLEIKRVTAKIYEHAQKRDFETARDLTDSLTFLTNELHDALGE